MTDPTLEAANRAAHQGMRLLVKLLREQPRLGAHYPELFYAAQVYEEAERRAQSEATR